MNLNSVEWARAQELLLRLVQVLGPFASREPNPSQALPTMLSRRFFAPPSGELPPFRYAARLLTTLADAKNEVDEWIGKLPDTGGEPGKATLKEEGFQGKGLKKDAILDAALKGPKERGGETLLKTSMKEGGSPNAAQTAGSQKGNAGNIPFTPGGTSPKIQVTSQAQQVIDQVRQAILTLSSSAYLIDPKAGPLRDALKRLKPYIDQLIEAVSQEGMHSAGEGLPQLFRFKISPSEREALLKKLIQFPQSNEGKAARRSFAGSSVVQETKSNLNFSDKNSSIDKNSAKDSLISMAASKGESEETAISPSAVPGSGSKETQAFDKTTIPGAPFTPQTQLNSSSRKNKKKRKGFWLIDENEPEDEERPSR